MRGSSTFSETVSSSIRLNDWNTKPILPLRNIVLSFSLRLPTSWPSRVSLPDEGLSNNPKMFNKVDLPQPEGPMTATNSPSVTYNETPFNAMVSISSVKKLFFKFSTFNIPLVFKSTDNSQQTTDFVHIINIFHFSFSRWDAEERRVCYIVSLRTLRLCERFFKKHIN